MPLRLAMLAIVFASATFFTTDAQANRLWHDVNGGKVRGTFKELKASKASIQTSSQMVRIPFWNLMPEDQKFIARRMREWRRNDQVPGITDTPREWMIDDRTVTGQLLEVEEPSVWIVVKGRKQKFSFEQLSGGDVEYARTWAPPLVQKGSIDRWDPFVSSDSESADEANAETDELAAAEAPPVLASEEAAPLLTRNSIRLGITVIVCLAAFGWRVLRRFVNSDPELDF